MKFTTNSLMVLVTLAVSMLFVSCLQDDETPKPNPFPEESDFLMPQNERMMILGEQLKNPYAIETMQRALHNLSGSSLQGVSTQQISIEPTHLYIKFLPQNEEELNILKRDSTLILYDHPLDFEILESGDYYHDPEVPIGQPTYQYCAVEINKQLPDGVETEVLAELYIPDEDKVEEGQQQVQALSFQRADLGVSVDALVDEALRITNNLTEPTQSTATSNDLEGVKVSYRRSKWRPAGTIQVYDDVLERYVGIEGVKVRARRWFTTHTGIANSDGEYSCNGRFRRDANYSIDWERYHFALQDGWLNGATYNGPKKRGDWDLNLNSGAQQYYATIFRAAYHYYYKDIKGLRRPPQNSFWRTQLKIRAYLENGSEDGNLGTHTSGWRAFGLYSPVKIYTYTRPSIDTYSTVIHELAHASHWNMDRSDFGDTETIVIESWARGVEWGLTKTVYSGYQPIYARLNYTGTVQDMIDGFGSKGTLYWWDYEEEDWGSPNLFNSYYDQISGYTLREIEDAIEGQKTWSSWKNNIINKFENDTEDSLGNGFNFWNTK